LQTLFAATYHTHIILSWCWTHTRRGLARQHAEQVPLSPHPRRTGGDIDATGTAKDSTQLKVRSHSLVPESHQAATEQAFHALPAVIAAAVLRCPGRARAQTCGRTRTTRRQRSRPSSGRITSRSGRALAAVTSDAPPVSCLNLREQLKRGCLLCAGSPTCTRQADHAARQGARELWRCGAGRQTRTCAASRLSAGAAELEAVSDREW